MSKIASVPDGTVISPSAIEAPSLAGSVVARREVARLAITGVRAGSAFAGFGVGVGFGLGLGLGLGVGVDFDVGVDFAFGFDFGVGFDFVAFFVFARNDERGAPFARPPRGVVLEAMPP